MILAALRDSGYKLVLFIHIVTMIVAMAGAVAHPLMFELEKRRDDPDPVGLAQRIGTPSRVYSMSYLLSGLLGFGLVSMGDWPWGDTWIWLGIVVWITTNGLLHALMLPAERAVADGDTSAVQKIERVGPPVTLLMLILVYLMVVKPGGSAL